MVKTSRQTLLHCVSKNRANFGKL